MVKIKKTLPKAQPKSATASPAPGPKNLAKQQFRSATDVIRPKTIPYRFWKEWHRARERNDYDLLYDLSASGSPVREAFGERESFQETVRRMRSSLPGLRALGLYKLRLSGPDLVELIQAEEGVDRAQRFYRAERWVLLRHSEGLRVHQIDGIDVPVAQEPTDIAFDAFPAIQEDVLALATPQEPWTSVASRLRETRDQASSLPAGRSEASGEDTAGAPATDDGTSTTASGPEGGDAEPEGGA